MYLPVPDCHFATVAVTAVLAGAMPAGAMPAGAIPTWAMPAGQVRLAESRDASWVARVEGLGTRALGTWV